MSDKDEINNKFLNQRGEKQVGRKAEEMKQQEAQAEKAREAAAVQLAKSFLLKSRPDLQMYINDETPAFVVPEIKSSRYFVTFAIETSQPGQEKVAEVLSFWSDPSKQVVEPSTGLPYQK